MIDRTKARELANDWINTISDIDCQILDEETVVRPYGWVFSYQSKQFLESGEFSDQLVGTAPVLVERITGHIKTFGTALSTDDYLAEYEKTIPKIWLTLGQSHE